MKAQRRTVLKGLLSAAGATGISLAAKAGVKVEAPLEKEVGEVIIYQQQPLFSKFTRYGNLIFISGVGCHEGPATIKNHTTIVMRDLKKAIIEAGSSMDKVLKCVTYIDDVANYTAMNKIYDKAWPKGKKPARSCVAVAKDGIPGKSLVEVDAIAYI
jgi:2-iminobutanoate/2-iminopropanoate deaminase